jgi:tight adherence protein B
VPLRPVELFYLVAGGGLLLGLLLAAATGSIALAVLAPVFTATLTHAFLVHRAARRLRAFDDQLPEFLTELSSALRVGHSLVQALRTVADDARPPIGKEVGRVLAEMSLGRPLEVALTDMSRRIPSKELDFFLTAVTIQRQVGGSLAGLFEIVAETVRQRHQFQRKLKSLIAMGKLSAWVIAAIPFGLALLLSARDHAYLAPLFRTPTGHLMLAAGVSMLALGALWLKKIVSIEG